MNTHTLFNKIMVLFRPFQKIIITLFVVNFIGYAIGALAPWLLGKTIDSLTTGSVSIVSLYLGLSLLATILQSLFVSSFIERYSEAHFDNDAERFLEVHSITKMLGYSIGQHINEHSGVKQSIVNKGRSGLLQLLRTSIYMIIPTVLQIVATLIIVAFFDWRMSILSLVFASLYCFFAYKLNLYFYPKIELIRKMKQDQSKLQSEIFRNSTLIITEAQEEYSTSSFEDISLKNDSSIKKTWLSFLNWFYLNRSLIVFGRYAVLGFGVYLIFHGYLSVGIFVALVSWVTTIFGNLIQLMNQQRQMLFQIVEIKKFFSLLEIESDIDINVNGKKMRSLNGDIEFRNVSFAYPKRLTEDEESSTETERDHAVSDISFTIPAGSKVGFVGLSGSGKSTIINLIRRYYKPAQGDIFVDGVNMNDLNLKWFRSLVGNVEQKIDLFDRTVRENILFGLSSKNKKISPSVLEKVLTDASLSEFVEKLPAGLDTMIGEGGIKVSGGERQRIGIARALIKNPKILIFDEATSALDSHNEKLIHDSINRSSEGRTTIIVAHRLSTVIDADIIFVVDDGKIVGEGTHDTLSLTCPEYQKLIKHQMVEAM